MSESTLPATTQQNEVAPRAVESAATALAAEAKATIEAHFTMALHRPRDVDDARTALLKECTRSSFAETAIYSKPIGKSRVQGASIRLVEQALRCWKNVITRVESISDTPETSIMRASVADMENNIVHSANILVQKTVERRQVKQGQEVLSSRLNSYGERTYLVRATDDEMLNKTNALVSKAIRNVGLRVLPGWLLEEAMAECRRTMASDAKKNPDAARNKLVDAFFRRGVKPAQIKEYLGHDIDQCTPAEFEELRFLYQGLDSGETTWKEIMEKSDGTTAKKSDKPKGGNEGLKAAIKKPEEEPESEGEAPSLFPDDDAKEGFGEPGWDIKP